MKAIWPTYLNKIKIVKIPKKPHPDKFIATHEKFC